jgi:hypothetical protein
VVKAAFYRVFCDFHREKSWFFDGVLWFLRGQNVVLMCMGWGDEKHANF